MLNLTRPTYLMPMHGDHKRLRLHAELGHAVGMAEDHTFRGDNGLPLDIDAKGARFGEREQAGMVFVDGIDLGEPNDSTMRDRRAISADGVMFIVATVSADEGDTLADHEIVLRGVPLGDDEKPFLKGVRKQIEKTLDRAADDDVHEVEVIQQMLHDDLAGHVHRELRRRPMVIPVVVEV